MHSERTTFKSGTSLSHAATPPLFDLFRHSRLTEEVALQSHLELTDSQRRNVSERDRQAVPSDRCAGSERAPPSERLPDEKDEEFVQFYLLLIFEQIDLVAEVVLESLVLHAVAETLHAIEESLRQLLRLPVVGRRLSFALPQPDVLNLKANQTSIKIINVMVPS